MVTSMIAPVPTTLVPEIPISTPAFAAIPERLSAVIPPLPSTLSIVIVRSLAGDNPPNSVPAMVIVSVGRKSCPAESILRL